MTNGWLETHTLQMEKEKQYLHWVLPTSTVNVSNDNSTNQCSTIEKKNVDDDRLMQSEEIHNDYEQSKGNVSAGWDAKYLSLWSTKGTIDEWYPIAKIDLLPSSHNK